MDPSWSRRWFSRAALLGGGILLGTSATFAGAATTGVIDACVKNNSGDIQIVTAGTTCKSGWSPLTWNQTGPQGPTGATGATGATGPQGPAGADGNDASDASRLQTWQDETIYRFNASPPTITSPNIINTSITVVVPPGKARFCQVVYAGRVTYTQADRILDSANFYADYYATLQASGTPVGIEQGLVSTEYRRQWDSTGGYWSTQYNAGWIVRLTEGTQNFQIDFHGYSDGSMNWVQVRSQSLQVLC